MINFSHRIGGFVHLFVQGQVPRLQFKANLKCVLLSKLNQLNQNNVHAFSTQSSLSNSTEAKISASDILIHEIDRAKFTIFNPMSMVMFQIHPAQFHFEQGRFSIRELGYLESVFLSRSTEKGKFDRSSRIYFRIAARHVGQFLIPQLPTSHPQIQILTSGNVNNQFQLVKHPEKEEYLECIVTIQGKEEGYNKNSTPFPTLSHLHPAEEKIRNCKVSLTYGEFCQLQTLIQHFLPTLYGWQVLNQPTNVLNYLTFPISHYTNLAHSQLAAYTQTPRTSAKLHNTPTLPPPFSVETCGSV